ncbi:hypothetical protein [Natrarchaeobius halalkaliphilus]|uniref:hypothetical protein n=1 Tax=Natrarchaeobius halalkaliphilus TaxID=1679091 RepID=UPI0014049C30|nr:hypothetical protein [Natrarchaeobius halalkaliphilus]
MTLSRRDQFVHWQLAWMLATVLALSLFGESSLELFFICSLIGLLVVTELTAPFNVSPAWRMRLPWLILFGFVVFGALVVRRILLIVPPEVLPA